MNMCRYRINEVAALSSGIQQCGCSFKYGPQILSGQIQGSTANPILSGANSQVEVEDEQGFGVLKRLRYMSLDFDRAQTRLFDVEERMKSLNRHTASKIRVHY
ncbi:unnamed protein product [Allacma fusca]|uniref:Uncharacterized protein n=1 Tax=Allacma fusca TaxID=39272 RepID=A0A8J2LUM9_9HEXA|nr:unnamed protein product [Allacma fusca]